MRRKKINLLDLSVDTIYIRRLNKHLFSKLSSRCRHITSRLIEHAEKEEKNKYRRDELMQKKSFKSFFRHYLQDCNSQDINQILLWIVCPVFSNRYKGIRVNLCASLIKMIAEV
jgi:DNA gyrase/topoisomerase IV subunit B